jgi:predicted LPLAT superfamily acyltransferase
MPEWSGKSKGGALGYRFFIYLIRKTDIRLVYFFVCLVAIYYFLFSPKKPSWFYFRKIHGYPLIRTLKSIYLNYCLLGQMLVDKVAVFSRANALYSFQFEGEQHLHQMSEMGKGGVLIGAHMGNWEIAGQLLDRVDTRVNVLMLEAEYEKIKDTLERVQEYKQIRIIPQKEDYSHLYEINKAFKRNELVVMHGDRYVQGSRTTLVNFLGRKARFPTGPLYLASKQGVPVSFVYTLKESGSHYHLPELFVPGFYS